MRLDHALGALRRGAAIAAAVLALTLAAAAHAEKADRAKPIHLEADRVTVDDAKRIAHFIGNVVLTQGTMIIRGDRMEMRQDNEGFQQGVAWGNLAYFRQKRDGVEEYIEGWAERIEYDGRAEKVQMFNRAMMKRGQDEVRGSYISYDAAKEFFQVEGGGTTSTTAKPGDGRVRAIMQPKTKASGTGSPPVTLKPDEGAEVKRGDPGVFRK